ncbi:hypothetical protein H6F96_03020 [Microcoleus sp. FACHB-53]|nr:hypothetical protein [Microcoleus sp. FACHB-53]MBD2126255.1 hypothetical protein [Microcoleus sp. FACHB-1]
MKETLPSFLLPYALCLLPSALCFWRASTPSPSQVNLSDEAIALLML